MFYVASTREMVVDPTAEPRQWQPAGRLHAAPDGAVRTLCGLEVTRLHRFYAMHWADVDGGRCRRCSRAAATRLARASG